MINFFRVNGAFLLVDLPGYGYARAPREVTDRWEGLVTAYLLERSVLQGVVLLVDARHAPGPLDQQMKAWLEAAALPYLVVANKIDKLRRGQRAGHLRRLAEGLELPEAPLAFSAQTGEGRAALWKVLDTWLRAPVRRDVS